MRKRPALTVTEVVVTTDAISPRWRALALLTVFTTLRFGELATLP
ncbi:hypothetical protein ACFVVA_15245 [Kitasatospora sp. NPDC058048]